jgi:MurNAc alpha-1-phosphate uridylyltransferase
MRAMILAAGRGERLRPLTDSTPKPLIPVAGTPLIEYHLRNLAGAGVKDIIINTAWLAENIHQQLGDGSAHGVTIRYSDEGTALETAGGIINALPLLGDEPFLVVNGDIYCELDFSSIIAAHSCLADDKQAHLVLVKNPDHNPAGDFAIEDGLIKNTGDNMYTFSGIGIYRPAFFSGQKPGALPLAPVIRKKSEQGLVSGEVYDGLWTDAGTLERIQQLESKLLQR